MQIAALRGEFRDMVASSPPAAGSLAKEVSSSELEKRLNALEARLGKREKEVNSLKENQQAAIVANGNLKTRIKDAEQTIDDLSTGLKRMLSYVADLESSLKKRMDVASDKLGESVTALGSTISKAVLKDIMSVLAPIPQHHEKMRLDMFANSARLDDLAKGFTASVAQPSTATASGASNNATSSLPGASASGVRAAACAPRSRSSERRIKGMNE